jgi:hypothetical protein
LTVAAAATAVVVALSPNPSHFGQLVTATVQGAGTPSFDPFAVREQHGDTYVLQCLDPRCAPGPGPRVLTVGGRRVVIVPRTTTKQVASPQASFRRQTAVPPPSYRIRPAALEAILLAAAGVLAVLAGFLAWPLVGRLVPERRDRRTALERALALARASVRRSPEDRRRALDLLGSTLEPRPVARDVLSLAWSRPEPEPERVETLVERLEGDA